MGFNTLTGLGTVDKYMREPSIFNPIFDINDIRSMEFESGPKKRKALDGILIGPSPLKYNDQESTMGDSNLSPLTSNQSSKDIKDPSPVIAVQSGFSPGSVEDAKIKRKRGRPVSIRTEKSANEEEGQVSTQRRRGRPAKANPTVGVKPNVFKRNQKRSATKQQQTIKAHWDNEMFDLTVDLDNHFVLVDRSSKEKSSCTIREINGEGDATAEDWNCRGLGNAATVRQLKELIRKSNPEVLILSEVRLAEVKLHGLMGKLHFPGICYVPPQGTGGGLALCWKLGVDCNIQDADKNKVIGIISSDPPELPWIIMGIYGPPSFGEKEEFWKKVGEYIDHCNFPLLLMGDLNGTLKDGENLNYANASNTTRYSFDLRIMVHRTGLVDLGYTGVKFTWFKKSMDPSVGSSLKRARLDRAMASTDWRVDWPNAIVSHLTATSSDHNPILLDTLGGKFCTKPQFKYEMMWERDPRVFWVVKRAWIEKGHQHPMVNLYRKIKHTKDHLTKWNKEQFKKLSIQINEARETLKSIEEAKNFDEKAHSNARADLEERLRREEIFWRQKSRVAWLKDGDRSTKFFMASTVTRRRRNYIQCLKNEQGESIEDLKEIAKLFIQKFTSTFSKNGSRIKFEAEDWNHLRMDNLLKEDLMDPPSEAEILNALASMGVDKAPGPDGFPVIFFRSHRDTIKEDFLNFIKHFFNTAELPHYINDTNIVLVPKKEGPSKVGDFRPIALCNVIYKCISKVITTRLRDILPCIISPTQTAFIKGRCITENTAIAKEIIHSMARKKGSKGFMMIKLDMEKAYDKMDWDFIMEVLNFHGFKNPLLGWIKSCIQIKKMNLMINGVKQGTIHPTSGLRQGDPLSPTLFILAADMLSRLLQDYTSEGRIKGIKVTRSAPAITHLMFADDVVLFGQATIKEAQAFLECLQKYCAWSGQAINLQKSTVFFSKGVPKNRISDITTLLGMRKMQNDATYLGIPLFSSKNRSKDMQYLVQRVLTRIDGWKARLLSKVGRTCLIQSVGTSIPIYVAASEEPQNLWSSIVTEKYLKGSNLFDVEMKGSESTLWKAILRSRTLLKEGMCREIGDGRTTSIWFDAWVPNGDHLPQPLLDATQGANLVNYFINENMTWNEERLRKWFSESDARNILNIGLPHQSKLDSWRWIGDPRGCFSVKSAFKLVTNSKTQRHTSWDWRILWNSPIHGRLKLLWWQIMRDALPTREKIGIVLPLQSKECPICEEGEESSLHLFWDCYFAKAIWFGSMWGMRTNSLSYSSGTEWMTWFQDNKHRPSLLSFDEFMTGALCIFKAIWDARNGLIHAEFAREHLKGKVAFQCDNEVVVANCSITYNTNQFIDIVGAINRFKNTVRLLDDFKISKIDRTYNFLAHNSAKWAAAVGATGVLDLGVMDEKVFSDVQEWNPD
uniref:Reverse transcriptase domain-containing protein n=1 Tax=Cannabis sativa TaxID=3483 RepID=A0A803NSM4_CANSA